MAKAKIVILLAILVSISFSGCIEQIGWFTTEEESSNVWAVLVSTGHGEIDIKWASNFSLCMRDILVEHGIDSSHIKVLSGYDATMNNFNSAMTWLQQNSDINSKIIFYFACHGAPSCVELVDGFLSYSALDEDISRMASKEVLLLIDACHSGGAIPYLKGDGRFILTACEKDEYALSHVFSLAIFAALDDIGDLLGDSNGWISAEELRQFTILYYSPDPKPCYDGYPGDFCVVKRNNNNIINQHYTDFFGLPGIDRKHIMGQSFKPSYSTITKVMINFAGHMLVPSKGITLSITDEPDLNRKLVSCTKTSIEMYLPPHRFYTFDIDDITVTPGKTYYLVLETEQNDFDEYGGVGVYQNGAAYAIYPATNDWLRLGDYDIDFVVMGNYIGEPSDLPLSKFDYVIDDLDVSFADRSTDGFIASWSWDFGDGYTSNQKNPMHAYSDYGIYTASLVATNSNGLTDTCLKTIVLEEKPEAPVASFSYYNKDYNTIQFTDASTDEDGYIVYWLWEFGDGSGSFEQSPSHEYYRIGNYTVTLTVTDNDGNTGSCSQTVTIRRIEPEPEFPYMLVIISMIIVAVAALAIYLYRKK